jgi:hypothetical protein
MRESRTYGFVRGAHSDMRPYRDPYYVVTRFNQVYEFPRVQMTGELPVRPRQENSVHEIGETSRASA